MKVESTHYTHVHNKTVSFNKQVKKEAKEVRKHGLCSQEQTMRQRGGRDS